ADRLARLPKLVESREISLLRTEGAVSIKYESEELLGIEFWDIIMNVNPVPNSLLEGKRRNIVLPYQSFGITLTPQDEQLHYYGESSSPNRIHTIDRILPLELFVYQWTSMKFRFSRLMASLGDDVAEWLIEEWESFMSRRWKSL